MVAPISSHFDCWRAVLSRGFIFFCSAVSAIGGLSIATISVVSAKFHVHIDELGERSAKHGLCKYIC